MRILVCVLDLKHNVKQQLKAAAYLCQKHSASELIILSIEKSDKDLLNTATRTYTLPALCILMPAQNLVSVRLHVSGENISELLRFDSGEAGLFANKPFIYGVINAPHAWD